MTCSPGCSARCTRPATRCTTSACRRTGATSRSGRDRGMALEESQSLLMEMIVCRSRPFVRYVQPLHREALRRQRAGVGRREHLRAPDPRAARPDPRGRRRAHLPAAHHAALRAREAAALRRRWRCATCRRPGTPAWSSVWASARRTTCEGCLQDIHWAVGSFGYFPSYALGAVIAAQLYESLRDGVPALDEQLARGEFSGPVRLAAHPCARARRQGAGAGAAARARPASRCRPLPSSATSRQSTSRARASSSAAA